MVLKGFFVEIRVTNVEVTLHVHKNTKAKQI